MVKECWQLRPRTETTPCFKLKGGSPCSGADCPVDDSLREMNIPGPGVESRTTRLANLLVHTTCRISSHSPKNAEFLERPSTGLFNPDIDA